MLYIVRQLLKYTIVFLDFIYYYKKETPLFKTRYLGLFKIIEFIPNYYDSKELYVIINTKRIRIIKSIHTYLQLISFITLITIIFSLY